MADICKLGNVLAKGKSPRKNIIEAVDAYSCLLLSSSIAEQRSHYLRCFPEYPVTKVRQRYVDGSEDAHLIFMFRVGNAGLGNRNTPPIKICPGCRNAPNRESHMVFECPILSDIRSLLPSDWQGDCESLGNLDLRLKEFLTDRFYPSQLKQRGRYLALLLEGFLNRTQYARQSC